MEDLRMLTKAKENATGLFFTADNQLYYDILEFQFIATKFETENTVPILWKSKTDLITSLSKTKSAIEKELISYDNPLIIFIGN